MFYDNERYRIGLANGKVGYGSDAWQVLVAAVGEKKADIIAAHIKHISQETGTIYAKNGVVIGVQEKRYL